jgi:hypothetical protein
VEEEESCISTDCIDIGNGVTLDGGCDERSVEAWASESLSGVVWMSRGGIAVYEEFASVGFKEGTGEGFESIAGKRCREKEYVTTVMFVEIEVFA